MQCTWSILGVLTKWDWHYSKQGQTRSFSTALFRRPALKKWCPWRQKKSFYTKTSKSSRPAPMVTLKANLAKRLELWCSSKRQQLPTNPTKPISKTGTTCTPKESGSAWSTNMFEDVQKDNEELDQASTGQPVAYDSSTLDFEIQGLLQASVEEAEHVCVREVTDRIESHLHQDELQTDLRQNNVYNQFSENRKKMIHDMGNVECFQLLETDSQEQCSYCLSYWTKEIVHCTCGICMCHTDEMRRLNQKRVDALLISNYVIKKGFCHKVRHGKSEEQIYHHHAYNAWKQCRKKKDAQGENYTGILDRFWRSPRHRKSQEELGWHEAECAETDKLTQKHYTYNLTKSECLRYSLNLCLQLNSSEVMLRWPLDLIIALQSHWKNHLYRYSEVYQKSIPPQDQDRVREDTKFSETYRQEARVDKKTVWKFWTSSSSSSSWRQSDQWDWKEC